MFSLDFKLKVDRILFGSSAYILDHISLLIGKFLNRNHTITKENIKNVVIAKYLGLGSIVRSQVIIQDIKNSFPDCNVYYLTSVKNKKIFDIIKNVDNVLTIDDSGIISMAISTFKLVLKLLKIRVDAFIDLEVYSRYSSCMALMSCARNRYGFFRHDIHWHIGIYTHMLYFNNQKNITDIYLQISNYLTNSNNYNKKLPEFNFKEDNKLEIEKYFLENLKEKKENDIYIGINANASELALERRYPPNYFVELIENLILIKEKNIFIFLIGAPNEKKYLEEEIYNKLSDVAKYKVFLTAGIFSLNASIYLLYKFDLFITTDSGPLHFAYAQNINIISIWGTGSYFHYGMINYDKEIYMSANVYCSPCLYLTAKPPCNGNNICLQKIYPYEIYKKSIEILKISEKEKYIENKKNVDHSYYLGSVIR
ncbi:glycosyltransferase family 9 protein [Brachyspira hampsonii]|uniref:ADP-heptose:LPS heptosyltransferase RfaF n=1 Tax=Brachyspira hampsonii 30446 TaxID=1289135 RepID=A0A2U4FRZ1_9SPIR|nr:glycosyltransferase family 9 protein [Brachyspira hampsonii]EKV58033.1 ADP-heptose:LPS heptosyltransferase RfaF [Brachyspira hampsonii 30446]MBW5389639.1 lipopolysaccharide heptosyltransferase family protein [Brachyspira hampsonii]MBW5394988.1 lipopolysaccharide heptosyltransferase family protein [Brachyspira hampsonii]OEJ16726.1 ADP-heptose--LPS heptosyltransferase [Brachyspira hampsonii]